MYASPQVGDCYIVVAGLIRQDEDGFACTVEDDTKEQRLFHADMMMSFAKAMLKDSKKVSCFNSVGRCIWVYTPTLLHTRPEQPKLLDLWANGHPGLVSPES